MKLNRILALVIVAFAGFTLACWGGFRLPSTSRSDEVRGTGPVTAQVREIRDVRAVDLATIGTLTIEVGDRQALRVEAQENLLPYIETKVRNATLTIATRQGTHLDTDKPIRYHLTVTGLDEIAVSSAGNVEMDELHTERLTLSLRSAGNTRLGKLQCTTLEVDLQSAGNLAIEELKATTVRVRSQSVGNIDIASGEVERQEIRLSSTGAYNAGLLDSAEAEVELSSTGRATIHVRDRLSARLSSTGDLVYSGDPRVTSSADSTGRVRHQDG